MVLTTTLRTYLMTKGLPKPFSRRPRLTVYRRELYDYAECINVAVLLKGRFPALDNILSACDQSEGLAEIRRILSEPPASPRLGQHSHASLGSIAII